MDAMTSRAINLSSSPTLKLSSSPALRIEGGLLGSDVLEALAHGDLPGQKPTDFGLPANRSLTEEIAAAFNDARAQWGVFQNRLERLPENETGTSETREFWVIPLLRLLGYSLQYRPRALEVDGATFAISHIVESEKSEKSENGRAREHESMRDRVSRSHALTLSRSHALTLSPSHPLTLSPSHALPLSHCHPAPPVPRPPRPLPPAHPLPPTHSHPPATAHLATAQHQLPPIAPHL
ncbi:hypothetical protein RY27_08715, partial [Litorilinea aerophila]